MWMKSSKFCTENQETLLKHIFKELICLKCSVNAQESIIKRNVILPKSSCTLNAILVNSTQNHQGLMKIILSCTYLKKARITRMTLKYVRIYYESIINISQLLFLFLQWQNNNNLRKRAYFSSQFKVQFILAGMSRRQQREGSHYVRTGEWDMQACCSSLFLHLQTSIPAKRSLHIKKCNQEDSL